MRTSKNIFCPEFLDLAQSTGYDPNKTVRACRERGIDITESEAEAVKQLVTLLGMQRDFLEDRTKLDENVIKDPRLLRCFQEIVLIASLAGYDNNDSFPIGLPTHNNPSYTVRDERIRILLDNIISYMVLSANNAYYLARAAREDKERGEAAEAEKQEKTE